MKLLFAKKYCCHPYSEIPIEDIKIFSSGTQKGMGRMGTDICPGVHIGRQEEEGKEYQFGNFCPLTDGKVM